VRAVVLVIGLVHVAGCKGDLNPAYCAQNRDDPDCLTVGVPTLDAATPECSSNPECVGDPGGLVCDTVAQQCVECLVGDDSSCPPMQVCGVDQQCVGCATDDDCASGVCLATRTCALAENILYAASGGAGPDCTVGAPCTFTVAAAKLSTGRHIIKLNGGGADYAEPPITIAAGFGVQIIGTNAVYRPTGGPPEGAAITATGVNLEILGLTIASSVGSGVACTQATSGLLSLFDATITESGAYGVIASNCDVTLQRSQLSLHPAGAIFVTGGTHEIRNNIIHGNGTSSLETGAVQIVNANGRLRFNTIVNTVSRSGGQRIGGVACSEATAGGFVVAQNIIANWGNAGTAIGPGCTVRDNHQTQDIASVRFVSTTDFHLTASSPPAAVLNANTPAVSADCTEGSGHIDDIDGQSRPAENYCDRGADEYRP
jgi:hypothetical protein